MSLDKVRNLKIYLQHSLEIGSDCVLLAEDKQAIIEALDKQILKKPDYEADGYDENGELVYDILICPFCGKKYEVDYDDS